jgi:catechol 2,3-dioxygenase-like lactoylglutathione lyase family enzyme
MTKGPALFRVTLEVSGLKRAATFYARLLGVKGRRVGGGRTYFDCGSVILALVDVKKPEAGPEYLYFAVPNVRTVHARARRLRCLSKEDVHGVPGGGLARRPWGEVSFYAIDPWGNRLCFVDRKTLFTGK